MSSSNTWSIESQLVFREKKYMVCADVKDDDLVLQVEEILTADRWKGHFEAKHIEELTRKTGNFKKFTVFLNMLESAIAKSSDSVTLDLLTYDDLEAMWDKKLGCNNKRGGALSPGGKPQAKRYLILTYSVEFDRIHYPLALPYCGRPDPTVLQATVRKLLAELGEVKGQLKQYRHSDVSQLHRENALLIKEKEQLEEDFLSYKHEVGGSSSKEVRVLKKVIKNLEEEILKEHTKHQRYINNKNKEMKELLQEVKDLKLSEKLLQTKVKNLTKELNLLKRGYRMTPSCKSASTLKRRQRSLSRDRDNKLANSGSKMPIRTKRSVSSDRKCLNLTTPSPSGTRMPRFDPTAYIEQKRRQQYEIDARLGKHRRSRSNSIDRLYQYPRSVVRSSRITEINRRIFSRSNSSRGSSCSRASSVESNDRQREVIISKRRERKTSFQEHNSSYNKENESALNQATEISDIDARLNALQEFMKRSLESAKNYSRR